jgi:hypothetical protein
LRRLPAIAVLAFLLSACYVYVRPHDAPMPEGRAVEIAYNFTRSRGLNPTSTRYVVYNARRGAWKVSLWLGPPSCGAVRVWVDAYNGNAYDFAPFLRGCGGAPPVIEEDRADF